MTFSRANAIGWAFGEKLTSVQADQIDEEHAAAIDGVGGGTYAPTNPIIIGGDGLEVTTTLVAEDATIEDLACTNLLVDPGPSELHGDMDHTGTFVHIGTINHTGTATFIGATNLAGTSTFSAGPVVLTGEAHVQKRFFAGPDADASFGVDQYDEVHVAAATLTATRTYTVTTSGAGEGSELYIYTESTTQNLTVNINGGTTFTLRQQSAVANWMQLRFSGGVWIRARRAITP